MKINIHIIFLVVLSLAIALSPSFVVGEISGGRQIEIRAEDILIAILGIFLIAEFLIFKIKKIQRPPLFFPVALWLGIGLLSVLVNWFFFSLGLDRGFFYFLKEIEFFFLYFYFFFYIKNEKDTKYLLGIWLALAVINAGYVFYQVILQKVFGEYGAAAIGEWGAFPSGSFFTILFVFFINIFIYYYSDLKISFLKKAVLGLLVFLPSIGVFSSASKTSFLGLVFCFLLSAGLLFLKKKSFKLFLLCLAAAVFLAIVLQFVLFNVHKIDRLTDVFSLGGVLQGFSRGRLSVIEPIWNNVLATPWYYYIIGRGVGFIHEAHNQFLRNLIEVGIIGSIIFFFLLIQIIAICARCFFKSRDSLKVGLSAGLLTVTAAMFFFSFATEPFIVVKLSEVYWVFAALTMAGLLR